MKREHCADGTHVFIVMELVLGVVDPFCYSEGAVVVEYIACHEWRAVASGDLRSGRVRCKRLTSGVANCAIMRHKLGKSGGMMSSIGRERRRAGGA